MLTRIRPLPVLVVFAALLALLPALVSAQGRGRGAARPRPAVLLSGHVFIGGYFYDPVFGPYPWWPRAAYPYRYYPIYDYRADVRVLVEPDTAAVYVDGFYAGIVDDFDGVFQSLPLPPGGHEIVVYLEGYRTIRHQLYLRPGSTLKLRDTLVRLAEGEESEPPRLAPPVPAPPPGTYRAPLTPPPATAPQPRPVQAIGCGTLNMTVQPAGAEVRIDGLLWVSSDGVHFVVELTPGRHRLDISLEGHRPHAATVEIRDGETVRLNVSLARAELAPGGPFVVDRQTAGAAPGQRAARYDPETERTFIGTVEAVEQIPAPGGRGRRSLGGTHLVLATGHGPVEVHLGPTSFLAERKLRLARGDSIEVLGSRVTVGDEPVVLARQVSRGGETWTLRDATGRPLWRGGR